MKKILIALCAFLPTLVFADIIVKKDGKTIEDVKVVSLTADNVVYKENGATTSIRSTTLNQFLQHGIGVNIGVAW